MSYKSVNLEKLPDAILVYCSDGRFFDAHEATAEKYDIKAESRLTDRIVVPGPSLQIIDEATRKAMLANMQGLVEFHKCREFLLIDHVPCGWMTANVDGYSEADLNGKIAITERHQELASEVIKHALPSIKLQTVIIGPEREIN